MWNFVGRQNDLEGHMENTNGNWISGIPAIDNYQWGSQKDMPAKFITKVLFTFSYHCY
jgi:hypothetical protein